MRVGQRSPRVREYLDLEYYLDTRDKGKTRELAREI